MNIKPPNINTQDPHEFHIYCRNISAIMEIFFKNFFFQKNTQEINQLLLLDSTQQILVFLFHTWAQIFTLTYLYRVWLCSVTILL